MNPNSANQTWSRWSFRVRPGRLLRRNYEEVRQNCARFGRKAFGAASQMNVMHHPASGQWIIMVRTEGHPSHDPQFVEYMRTNWERFFVSGFGAGTTVELEVRFEAGDRQDGTPREQLVVLPPLPLAPLRG